MGRVLYNRRSKQNPLWNQLVIGGVNNDGSPYLGYVDLQGTCYEDDFIATGFGMHLAIPLLREDMDNGKWKTMEFKDAKAVVEKCLKLLFYRDCKAINVVQYGAVTSNGVEISGPELLDTKWDHSMWTKTSKELEERKVRAEGKGVDLFTSGSDQTFVLDKYNQAFAELTHAQSFNYNNLKWGDEEVAKFAEVLAHCKELKEPWPDHIQLCFVIASSALEKDCRSSSDAFN